MTDILIRGVPDDVIEVVDARARRFGISRAEYLRRMLAREHPVDTRERPTDVEVTVEDFRRLAETCADARNPEIMAGAWR